jgi:hypothetical protein
MTASIECMWKLISRSSLQVGIGLRGNPNPLEPRVPLLEYSPAHRVRVELVADDVLREPTLREVAQPAAAHGEAGIPLALTPHPQPAASGNPACTDTTPAAGGKRESRLH